MMRPNNPSSVGALHPVFFMLLVYIISVVLAFFVCRMVYTSIYGDDTAVQTSVSRGTTITVLR